jgi:hypothetical protein
MNAAQMALAALLILFLSTGVVAAALLLRALLPHTAARLDDVIEQHPALRRFLMGLFNGPALFLVSILLMKSGPGKIPGLVLMTGLVFLTVLGLAAELPALSRGLLPEEENGVVRRTVFSGALLGAVNLLPFLGQALSLFLVLRALGTGVFFLFNREPRPASGG